MTDLALTVREHVRQKARADHATGRPRSAHNMNPSQARTTYEAEWDWCDQQKKQAQVVLAEVSPP